jgi:hypothetical protein
MTGKEIVGERQARRERKKNAFAERQVDIE